MTQYVAKNTITNVVWLLKYPGLQFADEFYLELIPKLMESAENYTLSPIYFDRYYKPLGKNQDLRTMREMARLRLEAAGDNESEVSCHKFFMRGNDRCFAEVESLGYSVY